MCRNTSITAFRSGKWIYTCLVIMVLLLGTELRGGANLIFWIDYADEEEIEFYRKQIKVYENNHPGVYILLEKFKDFQVFLLNRYKSRSDKELPDIIRGVSDGIGVFAENNMIRPLDEFLGEDELDQYVSAFIEGMRYKNAIYGFPASFETLCLFVNSSYFPEPISSISELERSATTLNGVLPLATNMVEPYRFIPWYYGFDGTFFDENDNPVFNQEAFINATKYILDLLKEKYVIEPEISNETAMVMFTDGWAATMISGPWDIVITGN